MYSLQMTVPPSIKVTPPTLPRRPRRTDRPLHPALHEQIGHSHEEHGENRDNHADSPLASRRQRRAIDVQDPEDRELGGIQHQRVQGVEHDAVPADAFQHTRTADQHEQEHTASYAGEHAQHGRPSRHHRA